MQISRLTKCYSRVSTVWCVLVFTVLVAFSAHAKPGAAIKIQGPSFYQMDPFSSRSLNIEFSVPATAASLKATLQSKGSLRVVTPTLGQQIEIPLEQNSVIIPVDLETRDVGIQYLMFNFEVKLENGRIEARSLGLKIQVGDVKKQQKSTAPKSVKVLPAKETVH